MTKVVEYMSPWKNNDASTVNASAYHNSDEYEDEISDSSKQVEASKEPITDTHVRNTLYLEPLVLIQPSLESEYFDKGGIASPKA